LQIFIYIVPLVQENRQKGLLTIGEMFMKYKNQTQGFLLRRRGILAGRTGCGYAARKSS
jgi:hypothetical protein